MEGSLANPPESMRVVISTQFLSATIDSKHHNERNLGHNTSSQTVDVKSYSWGNMTFIDVPGFADTAGPDQDDINLIKILEFATKTPSLTGVVILLNGTVSRATTNVQTVLSRLRGNIPDVAINNIIYVITNCSSRATCNFPLDTLPFDFTRCKIVYINNSAFSSDPSDWSAYEKNEMVKDWNKSFSRITDLLQHTRGMASFSTDHFQVVLSSRHNIVKGLGQALVQVQNLVVSEGEVLDVEASIKSHLNDKQGNKNYVISKYICREELWSVTCSSCEGAVHFIINKVSPALSFVRYCGVCEDKGKCLEDEQMRSLYQKEFTSYRKDENDLKSLQNLRIEIKKDIAAITTNFERACIDIKHVCSNFSVADEFKTLIFQLKSALSIDRRIEYKQCISFLVKGLEKIFNAVGGPKQEKRQEKMEGNSVDHIEEARLKRIENIKKAKDLAVIEVQQANNLEKQKEDTRLEQVKHREEQHRADLMRQQQQKRQEEDQQRLRLAEQAQQAQADSHDRRLCDRDGKNCDCCGDRIYCTAYYRQSRLPNGQFFTGTVCSDCRNEGCGNYRNCNCKTVSKRFD